MEASTNITQKVSNGMEASTNITQKVSNGMEASTNISQNREQVSPGSQHNVKTTDTIWRAFYTRPRHELKAAARLEEAGIEIYCPTVTTKVRWSDRWKKVTKVLFTSYIFAKVDEKQRITVLEDDSVSRCVLYLGKPATIRDEEIEAIRFLLDNSTDLTMEQLKPGSKVRIADGPLKGRHAELINYTNANMAILRLEALGTEIHATLTPQQLNAM